MNRVLVISSDTVDKNMGGMGVRYWEISKSLAKHCQVTLAVPNQTELSTDSLQVVSFDLMKGDLRQWATDSKVIILQGAVLHFHPYLRELGVPLVVDLYDPSLLEGLVWHDHDDWNTWLPAYEEYLRVQIELLRAGDFFFCASERQRDYWLGWLHALKRINPHTFRDDPTFRKLIDVVSFGLPMDEPIHQKAVLKGVLPEICSTDRVILWAGGLWDWLDPLTVIRAMAELVPTHPELKLYFLGTKHPNSVLTGMTMPHKAIQLSKELGLYGKHIFFGDWTPYEDRADYLLEADLSIVAHTEHLETHFSFRTRILDCIWARLPLVVTSGDLMSDWVVSYNLGQVVSPLNVPAMSEAIIKVLSAGRQAFNASFENARNALVWDQVISPLLTFCLRPNPAPDKKHYLTETERMAQAKDAFLSQVVTEKDAFLNQVIQSKDAFLNQVIQSKDAFVEQVIKEKDDFWKNIIMEKDAQLERQMSENAALQQRVNANDQELARLYSYRFVRAYIKVRRFLGWDR
ncbi:MAG: glycosyltransferase family 4 protein [Chloroflexi bacterium]|nr:glycosyltransferase family 4 protein [Chloroflexota bacterium]